MKFLEEYTNRQALIWKIFSKHQNIPDEISDLHLHIDDFKGNIQKEFNFLKEVTRKNIENFQASLSSQQTHITSYDTRTHTSIQQRQRTSLQRAITWAPTLWSPYSIPTEQDPEENQKDSVHETEIRK